MNDIERRAALHATWRVLTVLITITAVIGITALGIVWLTQRFGPPALILIVAAVFGAVSVVSLWSAFYSYAKRQIENGTPKKDWWF